MIQIRLIIYIVISCIIGAGAIYVYHLWHRVQTLEGVEQAYNSLIDKKGKPLTYSQTNSGDDIKVNATAMKKLLNDSSVKQELKNLGFRIGQVSALTQANQKLLINSNMKGSNIEINHKYGPSDSGLSFSDSNRFYHLVELLNKRSDSLSATLTLTANLKIIESHSRKKFFGIGLGKKTFKTTVTSDNPYVKFGQIETIESK